MAPISKEVAIKRLKGGRPACPVDMEMVLRSHFG